MPAVTYALSQVIVLAMFECIGRLLKAMCADDSAALSSAWIAVVNASEVTRSVVFFPGTR